MIIVGNERNFAALRPRLFAGAVSSKVASQVWRGSRPRSVDLARLAPGTVLEIPDHLPSVSIDRAVALDSGSQQAIAAVLNAGAASIAGLVAGAKARQDEVQSARKPLAAALTSNALLAPRRKDPSLGPRIAAAQKALAAADAADKERRAVLAQAHRQWRQELEGLGALVELP